MILPVRPAGTLIVLDAHATKTMSEERPSMRITLTTSSLVRILAVLVALYFAYLIRDILVIIAATIILASAIDPWVDWMQKKAKLPRPFGIALIYVALLSLIGLTVYLIIPPITAQFSQLASDLPSYIDRFSQFLSKFHDYSLAHGWINNIKASLGSAASDLPNAAGSVLSGVFNFFGGIFSFIIVLVITFYILAEENVIRKLLWSITPEHHQHHVMDLFNRINVKLGLWLRGQLVLCLTIFVLDFVGLWILGVKYALILALIAGITEFIPYLGPILGAIPAVFLAFTQSPILALFTAILFFIVQQLENNLLVPKIMEKAVGLNPIVSIVALMIGFSIDGVVGALLSIPIATAATVIIEDLLHKKHALTLKANEGK